MSADVKVPSLGESIFQVEVGDWLKSNGDVVKKDENLVTLETEKATVEVPSPITGKLMILKKPGDSAVIGEVIAKVEEVPAAVGAVVGMKEKTEEKESLSAPVVPEKKQPQYDIPHNEPESLLPERHFQEEGTDDVQERAVSSESSSRVEKIRMSPLRKHLAQRLVEAQQQAALLTTFNEIDMSEVLALRKKFQEAFQNKFNVKLGLMSFFVKSVVDGLKQIREINASVEVENIVYHNYYDIGIAVSTDRGLVVPVLRNADQLSFELIELKIADFAHRARENKLLLEELQGGTFTITNGGVFGSLFSTPIVNPPQSAILGMHAIQDRAVVYDEQIAARPMMYVALTYDHRVIDGREAVRFLKHIKEIIEAPVRLFLGV